MDRDAGGMPILLIGSNIREAEVVKTADWIVDLGPKGGEVVAVGTPEKVEGSRVRMRGISGPLLGTPGASTPPLTLSLSKGCPHRLNRPRSREQHNNWSA